MRATCASLLCLVLAGCCEPEPSPQPPAPPPPATGPELAGLRATTPRIERQLPGPLVEVDWRLEWTSEPTVTIVGEGPTRTFQGSGGWMLEPRERVSVDFFDAGDKRVGADGAWVSVPPAFNRGEEKVLVRTLLVTAPTGAVALQVRLGRSGLETARAPIPAGP